VIGWRELAGPPCVAVGHIVTSNGEGIKRPLPGAGSANPYCSSFKPKETDTTENARSIGSIVRFGRFRLMHLGDLSWNKEFDLMCPMNRIGAIDLFVVSHHGESNSKSEVLVHGTKPRVAIMNNGTRKGGQPDDMKVIYSSPGSKTSGRCTSRRSAVKNTPCRGC